MKSLCTHAYGRIHRHIYLCVFDYILSLSNHSLNAVIGVIYPYFKEKGYPLTMLIKIGLGLGFACLAMVVACVVEVYRVQTAPAAGNWYDVSAR